MTCTRCSKDLEAGSLFCRFCGAAAGTAVTQPRPWSRRRGEGKVAGVCAGLAAYLDVDVTLVRLAWVFLSIVPGLLLGGVIAYGVAWVVLPEAQPNDTHGYKGPALLRSVEDRKIAGICGGLANYLGVDATTVRIVTMVLAVYPGAVLGGVVVYLIAWFIIPSAPVTRLHTAVSPM